MDTQSSSNSSEICSDDFVFICENPSNLPTKEDCEIVSKFLKNYQPYTDSEVRILFRFMYCLIQKFEGHFIFDPVKHRNGRIDQEKSKQVKLYNSAMFSKFERIYQICKQMDSDFDLDQECEKFGILCSNREI